MVLRYTFSVIFCEGLDDLLERFTGTGITYLSLVLINSDNFMLTERSIWLHTRGLPLFLLLLTNSALHFLTIFPVKHYLRYLFFRGSEISALQRLARLLENIANGSG